MDGQDFSHLVNNNEAVTEDSLDRIRRLAKEYKQRAAELAEADNAASLAKKSFDRISMELLPEAMISAGMTSFELDTGEKISYKEEANPTVKDYDKFIKWLEERGDDGMVKVTLSIGKTPQNVLNKIVANLANDFGILAEVGRTIHFQTLKSYISGLCGFKKNTVAEISAAELDSTMISLYTYYKTTIK